MFWLGLFDVVGSTEGFENAGTVAASFIRESLKAMAELLSHAVSDKHSNVSYCTLYDIVSS